MFHLPGVEIPHGDRSRRFDSYRDYTTSCVHSTRDASGLSSLLCLIAFILSDEYGSSRRKKYFHAPGALLDASFTGQRPIIGAGYHFTVFTSPFEQWEKVSDHVKRYNREAYCI